MRRAGTFPTRGFLTLFLIGFPGRLLFSTIGMFMIAGGLSAAIIESVEVSGTCARPALETRAGDTFSPAAVRRDVRHLWKTGKFDDVRVESSAEGDHVRVLFRVAERSRFFLRNVRFQPPGERRALTMEKGDPVNETSVREAARSLEKELVSDGFPEAHVETRLIAAGAGQADVEVRVERGPKVSFGRVDLEGVPGLDTAQLRQALKATAPRRWLPGIAGVWKGWVRPAPYSLARIESDLAALRALYIAQGYLAATVGLAEVRIEGNRADVEIQVDAGPRYRIEKASIETPQHSLSVAASRREIVPRLCGCLLGERAKAEREGRLDFNVRLEWEPLDAPPTRLDENNDLDVKDPNGLRHDRRRARHAVPLQRRNRVLAQTPTPAPAAPGSRAVPEAAYVAARSRSQGPRMDRQVKLVARVEPGPQYRVGRIDFRGNNTLRDSTLRRALVIQEGDWLDPRAIRASLARLNEFEALEPLSETDVRARPSWDNTVDLTISVDERKHGRWSMSGPLGPVSWFGPLRFAVDSRLPPWGRGILDLSTWLVTFGVVSYTDPVMTILTGDTTMLWQPFAALRRPLLPGQETTSGFLLSPSLGWREHLIHAGVLHARARAGRALGSAGYSPAPLAATMGRREQDGSMVDQPGIFLCKPRKPRLDWLRSGTRLLWDLTMGGG
jgi:hypothetical protein